MKIELKMVYVKTEVRKSLHKVNKTVLKNKQFYCLFFYLILKILTEFSKEKQ